MSTDLHYEIQYQKWLRVPKFDNIKNILVNKLRLIHLISKKNSLIKLKNMGRSKSMILKQRNYRKLQKSYATENNKKGFYKNLEID